MNEFYPGEVDNLLSDANLIWTEGDIEEARSIFTRVLESKHADVEQKWYCMYSLARLSQETGTEMQDLVIAFAAAYDFYPCRLEPLAHLCRIYRKNGDYSTTLELSRIRIGQAKSKPMFYEPFLCEVVLPLEEIHALVGLCKKPEALECARLLLVEETGLEMKSYLVGIFPELESIPFNNDSNHLSFLKAGSWEK